MSLKVTNDELRLILQAYSKWKSLNNILSSFASRTVNFPEAISESIASYYYGYTWHNKKKSKDKGDGKTDNGLLVEVKATSNFDSDLTSFSPDTSFDVLIFARLDKEADVLYLYNLNMNYQALQFVAVNAKETVLDHQMQGKRPRFSVIEKIIKVKGLEPDVALDLKVLATQLGVRL